MGGVVDFIFGSEPETNMVQTERYTPAQMELLNQLSGLLQGQLGKGVPGYPGQITPEPTANLQALFQMVPGLADVFGGAMETVPGFSDLLSGALQGTLGGFGQTTGTGQDILGGYQDPISALLGSGIGAIPGFQERLDPIMAQMERGAGTGMDYLSQLLAGTPGMDERYFEEAIKAPAMRAWEQELMPSILEQYAGMDALDSGAARRALASGAADLSTGMSQQLMEYLTGQQGLRTGAAGQMAGLTQGLPGTLMSGMTGLTGSMLPSLTGAQTSILGNLLGTQAGLSGNLIGGQNALTGNMLNLLSGMGGLAGTEYDITAQQGQEAYQNWAQQQPWANPWLNLLGPTLGTTPYDLTAVTTGGSGGLLGGILPGLAGGVGMGLGGQLAGGSSLWGALGSIFSDQRLKENLRKVGEMELKSGDRVNVYEFNYKAWQELPRGKHVGVIAQELNQAAPDCVTMMDLGGSPYFAVDYGKLMGKIKWQM